MEMYHLPYNRILFKTPNGICIEVDQTEMCALQSNMHPNPLKAVK